MGLPSIDMPWYKPTLNRNSVTTAFTHIPHQKLVKGAFIVREGNGNTQYCLSILTDPDNVHLVTAFKHILISQTREGKFHICLRPDEYDFIFASVPALILFYQTTSIGIHYHDTNCVLTNMFDKDLQIQQVGIHDMPKTNGPTMQQELYGANTGNEAQLSTQLANVSLGGQAAKQKSANQNVNGHVPNHSGSDSGSAKDNLQKVPLLHLPRELKRSRKRDAYRVVGAVQCRENYQSRNPNQEASMKRGEIFIQVGNKSGPWIPIVPYAIIEHKTQYEMEQGLDIQKRYAPEGYVDKIEVQLN